MNQKNLPLKSTISGTFWGILPLSTGLATVPQLALSILAGMVVYLGVTCWLQREVIIKAGLTPRVALARD